MIRNNDTTTIANIETFITKGKSNSYTLDNTNIYAEKDGLVFPYTNILREKYRGVILQNCQEINITNEELFRQLRYRPKHVSEILYGTIELWHLLLWINNMVSVTQFNRRRFLILHPDKLSIIDNIINLEYSNLYDNRVSPDEILEENIYKRR